jgi:hypothetical protein
MEQLAVSCQVKINENFMVFDTSSRKILRLYREIGPEKSLFSFSSTPISA